MNKKLRRSIFDKLIPNIKRKPHRFNMTLGSFIKALKRQRDVLNVIVTGNESIGVPHVYKGYPGSLAFAPTIYLNTVAQVISHCDEIMNRNFGETLINHNSILWICEIEETEGKPIFDVVMDGGVIKIITENLQK